MLRILNLEMGNARPLTELILAGAAEDLVNVDTPNCNKKSGVPFDEFDDYVKKGRGFGSPDLSMP